MAKCENCLHYKACFLNSEYQPSPCRVYKDKADVVEVVRCKDCIHYKTDTEYCREHNKGYCEWDNVVKSKRHFCSYGERKDEG